MWKVVETLVDATMLDRTRSGVLERPGVNTEGPGVQGAPTPAVPPHAERGNPDGVRRSKQAVSRPRGRPKPPAGAGRIEKRTPAAERRGETITRRIGLYARPERVPTRSW